MSKQVIINGVVREWWDDLGETGAPRTFHEYGASGAETLARPYTPEEVAEADSDLTARSQESARRAIEDALDASLVELQVLLDASAATINAGPAPYIKTLARVARRLIRLLLKRLDGTA